METIEATKQILSVRELLENTYEKLGERNSYTEIILPKNVTSEIADDSDWHRTRVGYMGYDKVRFFNFNDKSWLVSNGKSCGDYPARPYDSDILALELAVNENPDKVCEQFQKNISSYFRNSLLIGMNDGVLAVDGGFSQRMDSLLRPRFKEFIAEMPRYNKEVLSLDNLSPINTSSMKYKPEFADFLAEIIERVLKES